ncbi:hypothetical protein GCM10011391_36970 [Pullulanibacillus camelliae]|uniref:SpoVT-AbrB domain-containing protein n=1 Tax=Pullulanibacillus camelliae TaxID=1707096 RepID=A0A8J3E1Q0_9BACL|nr:hypothetical protein [Pullulanibacillus camelliae]GGE54648.1 hypothetical protein GCM10011391_36970 [Pullulanibacillus camelliae]
MKEPRKVTRTGNSLSVGLPKKIVDILNVKRSDVIECDVEEDRMILNKRGSGKVGWIPNG